MYLGVDFFHVMEAEMNLCGYIHVSLWFLKVCVWGWVYVLPKGKSAVGICTCVQATNYPNN